MSRYIDADALIQKLKGQYMFLFGTEEIPNGIGMLIENFPTADVVEVVHGEWKVSELGYPYCSKCGTALTKSAPRTNYCSCCGADMRERREDE